MNISSFKCMMVVFVVKGMAMAGDEQGCIGKCDVILHVASQPSSLRRAGYAEHLMLTDIQGQPWIERQLSALPLCTRFRLFLLGRAETLQDLSLKSIRAVFPPGKLAIFTVPTTGLADGDLRAIR